MGMDLTHGLRMAIFDRLDAYSYLSALDRGDFLYYRSFFANSLLDIDARIESGSLCPVDLEDFPQVVRFPGYDIKATLFIGSFDPFQMTHLATALRYLASSRAEAPVVFVVPEGHDNPQKPRRNDYRYRFELLSMRLEQVFDPLIVPLDIGGGGPTPSRSVEFSYKAFVARRDGSPPLEPHVNACVGSACRSM
jgi:hypothetical protein